MGVDRAVTAGGDPGVLGSLTGGVMSRPQRAGRSTSALVSVDSAVERARHDAVDMLVDAASAPQPRSPPSRPA